ncbi:MAG TPA: asparagine synthase (glutamine-hydrolyzing), partial [Chitinophagaceae bacterium]|nr:asparagine synthase (glutamine-hydrolyzing) [Chitinophagaceae bacterium]
MCGIVGIYNFKRKDREPGYINWCLSTMKHRGPDAQNIWQNNKNYIAGFARLAIRDLSENGNQPMLSDCGNYCLSFNGEIYNTGYIKKLLEPYRSTYKSTSDTELLLYALVHLGIDRTLEIIDGIFAFAFYDSINDKLILARDRVGVKPLYLGTGNEGIVYSSQYDHIINHHWFKNGELSDSSIAAYLSLGYMPENDGIINKTRLFPHGHYAIAEKGSINFTCYYQYSFHTESNNKNDFEEIFAHAVNEQLVSDVPVGTFMSGGVDSTLVSYFANQNNPIHSFTIGVKDNAMDESAAAARFADRFGTKHFCRFIDDYDFQKLINDNVAAFSEPFADFSSIPTLLVSSFAKEKVTVALSGDGGDELFWGYPRNRKALELIPFYLKSPINRRFDLVYSKLKNYSLTDITRHWNHTDFFDYYYSTLFTTGAITGVPNICKATAAKAFFFEELMKNLNGEQKDTTYLMNIARKMEMDIHLQRILLKVDRASMFHSLEVRVPFLSNAMLEHSLSYTYKNCIEGA